MQLQLNAQPQVQVVVKALSELGAPKARLKDICGKVLEFNEKLGLGYVAETLANSVRRAIYEHLGDDKEGVFVRDGRGYYRLSIKVLRCTVVHADAWEFVKLLPDDALDCVVTDPPWTALDKHRAWGTTTRLKSGTWFKTKDVDKTFLQHMARALKPGKHAYVFFPALNADTSRVFCQIRQWLDEVGLRFEKMVVWDKLSIGMGYRFRYRHELVMFLSSGKAPMRRLNNLGIGDVLQAKKDSKPVHDCQKPLAVLKTLIGQSTEKGELVADFFAGSGSTGAACKELERDYLLVDVELQWVEHMEKTLAPARVLELMA